MNALLGCIIAIVQVIVLIQKAVTGVIKHVSGQDAPIQYPAPIIILLFANIITDKMVDQITSRFLWKSYPLHQTRHVAVLLDF